MALIFPQAQAIRFLETGELSFNNSDLCGCRTDEKFAYQFTQGDNICFQLKSECTESEEQVLNGSFENGESSTSITSWARDVTNEEQTTVQRLADGNAPCGAYVAKWTNVNPTPNFAQLEQSYTFEQGKNYKLTLRAKIEFGGDGVIKNILEIIAGGQSYYITPTTSWVEYELTFTFPTTPATPYLQIKINEIPTDVQALYVDCVSMIEYGECCINQHDNNGCFELGQNSSEATEATFDNWATSGISESLTGGYDGSRCAVFDGIGSTISQANVLLLNTNYSLKFWAKSDVAGTTLDIVLASGILDTIVLTTTWTLYTYEFNSGANIDIQFELTADEISYIDCVELDSYPSLTVYIKNSENDSVQLVSSESISVYKDVINVCFNVDDYEMPECFTICVQACLDNLFLNFDFSQGSGNLFTNWTLTQPSRTNLITRSNEFDQWTASAATVTPNAFLGGDKLIADNTNAVHLIMRAVANTGATWTYSVYAMKAEYDRLVMYVAGSFYVGFNLTLGTVESSLGTGITSASIFEDPDNAGRYLCSITSTTTSTGTAVALVVYNQQYLNGNTNPTFTGDNVSGIYIWESQLETGAAPTPRILTGATTVTTSVGEFLENSNGLGGSRCLKMWANTSTTELSQSITQVAGTIYTISFWARVDELFGNDLLVGEDESTVIDSTEWKYYEQTYTALGSGSASIGFSFTNDENFGFIYLDDVRIFEQGTELENCSENMHYDADLDACYKELVWYDNKEETLVVNYASGFVNRMRVNAQAQNPQYIKEAFTKTLNGTESVINSIKVKKTIDLNFDSLPEFIWDILANMIGVSNIEYNGKNYTPVIETEVSPQPDKNTRLYSGVVTLGIEGEYIAESTFNCP